MSRDDEAPVLHTHGKPPLLEEHGPLPCMWCQVPTARATLNTYGAQCYVCYAAYCRKPQARPRVMADKRTEGGKAWARALVARQEHGEVLTLAQRTMAAHALDPRLGELTQAGDQP